MSRHVGRRRVCPNAHMYCTCTRVHVCVLKRRRIGMGVRMRSYPAISAGCECGMSAYKRTRYAYAISVTVRTGNLLPGSCTENNQKPNRKTFGTRHGIQASIPSVGTIRPCQSILPLCVISHACMARLLAEQRKMTCLQRRNFYIARARACMRINSLET